ncbi:unnamed protein product, partial [Owenia fusiformis]
TVNLYQRSKMMKQIICVLALVVCISAQDECRANLTLLWNDMSENGTITWEDVREDFLDLATLVSPNGDSIPLADGVCTTGLDVATCLTERDTQALCQLTASADPDSDSTVITISDIRVLFNRADTTGNGIVYEEGFRQATNAVCVQLPDRGQDDTDCLDTP